MYRLGEIAPYAGLSYDLPSRLADRLANGELDVAPIPFVEYLQDSSYEIGSNACIGRRGSVLSVKLLTRVPFDQIRTLALDEGSRTSVALVRILPTARRNRVPASAPLIIETFHPTTNTIGQTMQHILTLVIAISLAASAAAEPKPLKVFILAGQSNMEGHAKVETFDYIGDDPATASLLKKMRNADGTPRRCDHVWISYFTGGGDTNGEGFGKLTAGYGARRNPSEDGGKIGPEFTFGITMDEAYEEPVLIIKTAWGGKSLFYDYRPPSAGVYPRSEQDIAKNRNTEAGSGLYYRLMTAHVKSVLGNIQRVCPEYDMKQGYEIAGFVWFQGFNDLVNREVYATLPKGSQENRFAKYSVWMADFIRDVRKDLDAPKMPFVIGVLGVGGKQANEDNLKFREAMAAPDELPEFRGNVIAVQTGDFWDEPLAAIQEKREQVKQMAYLLRTKNKNHANKDGTMTDADQRAFLQQFETDLISPTETALYQRGASNAGYHYLGCAKTFALMGEAFAEAIQTMRKARTE